MSSQDNDHRSPPRTTRFAERPPSEIPAWVTNQSRSESGSSASIIGNDGPPLNPPDDLDDGEGVFEDGASIRSMSIRSSSVPDTDDSSAADAQQPGSSFLRARPTVRAHGPSPLRTFGEVDPHAGMDSYLESPTDGGAFGMGKEIGKLGALTKTVNRRQKTVKLGPSGNFVIKSKVADELLSLCPLTDSEEFTTVRYTAVTCGMYTKAGDPDDFINKGYSLRVANYRREVELFIVVTMYNEDYKGFNRTMFGLAENLKYLCKATRGWGWDDDSWRKVVICIVSDGRSKIDPDVLKCLELMGVYQDGLAQSSINSQPVEAHVFEFTAQIALDHKLNVWTAKEGIVPMQIIFCLKEKNAKKINSHRWFFNAFAPLLNPRVCTLIDVGTKPSKNALWSLWEAFFRNEQIAGACGEIRVDMGIGKKYFSNLFNPLVAAQNFEYKISNLLDKSLESVFGYISVLPGAFSAYRYVALLDNEPGSGPLSKYFEGEVGKQKGAADSSVFTANLYLAEDRILCFELVAKRHARWTLHYVSKAYAETDVPDSVPEFLSQRRRWLNGSLFAGFYALANIQRIWMSDHRFLRKIGFTIQYLYNVINQLFTWFILGNFAATFYFLFNELQSMLRNPYDPDNTQVHDLAYKTISILITVAEFSYPIALVCLFIISFGNRPQAFKYTYTGVMFILGVIGIVMVALIVQRVFVLFQSSAVAQSQYDGIIRNYNSIVLSAPVTNDPMVYMLREAIWATTDVMNTQLKANLALGNWMKVLYIGSLSTTFGTMFAASFLQFDFSHMFLCFVQYLMMLPSFINVLTVYALSNLHDVSWGTKGDNVAEALPSVAAVKQKDGSVVANVNVVSDRADRSLQYISVRQDLARVASNKSKKGHAAPAALSQDDEYRGFRTKLILFYLASNAGLFFVAVTLGQTDTYIVVLMGGIALLQGIKFCGVLLFIAIKFFTDVLHFNNHGRKKYREMMRAGGGGGAGGGGVEAGHFGPDTDAGSLSSGVGLKYGAAPMGSGEEHYAMIEKPGSRGAADSRFSALVS
ncbi:Chitin synthase, class 1 [Irineochytrium annulatum]|nr:Chitin synthase, class 1 [Irineochytrium annulatum]